MVEVKGKLSSLFGRVEIYTEVTDEILESLINRPITKDGKCIGIIKNVDVENDEWSGFLFDSVAAGISEDNKCTSINFINLVNL
jgi:hypothetical protein